MTGFFLKLKHKFPIFCTDPDPLQRGSVHHEGEEFFADFGEEDVAFVVFSSVSYGGSNRVESDGWHKGVISF